MVKIRRLGEMLISQGVLTEDGLSRALEIQKETKKRLGEVLVDEGFVTEGQIINTLSTQLGIDYVDLTKTDIDPSMTKYIPKNVARKNLVVPIKVDRDSLYLAMTDPLNFYAVEEAGDVSHKKIIPLIASKRGVERAINTLYGNEGAAKAIAEIRESSGGEETAQQETVSAAVSTEDNETAAPIIRLVDSIIERACAEKASDIHFEPTAGEMIVRMRIDGQLHRIITIPADIKESVTSRLKIMGKMSTVERRVPQDGRAVLSLKDRDVDMRLSTLPSIYGEKTVIRILGAEQSMLTREGIGIPADENEKLSALLRLTSGVIMIVGPTGSGKSSTMYTLVHELISESTNLITLEDPVEYHIDGVTQVQINEKVGLTFASGLRSILRQDPDVICVGEIRDGETAEIAMRAAMTGHLVITTIHTEDAVSAIDRLRDMGVPSYLISAGLRGVISQRLLRRVCTNCKREYTPEQVMLDFSKIKMYPGRKFYHGAGCDLCFHTGYRGRIGTFEILTVNEDVRAAINGGATPAELREVAKKQNFVSMLEYADYLVGENITTVEEIVRNISFGG